MKQVTENLTKVSALYHVYPIHSFGEATKTKTTHGKKQRNWTDKNDEEKDDKHKNDETESGQLQNKRQEGKMGIIIVLITSKHHQPLELQKIIGQLHEQ